MHDVLLIGGMARAISQKFGVTITAKQIRALILGGLLPEPSRLGPFRAFRAEDITMVEHALRAAGRLPGADGATARELCHA
jgi:hypothetical protein